MIRTLTARRLAREWSQASADVLGAVDHARLNRHLEAGAAAAGQRRSPNLDQFAYGPCYERDEYLRGYFDALNMAVCLAFTDLHPAPGWRRLISDGVSEKDAYLWGVVRSLETPCNSK